MKLENIKSYRFFCLTFFIIISILIYFNMKYVKQIDLNRRYDKPIVGNKSNNLKAYGYSEALEVLSKEPNVSINTFNNIDNKKLLKVELNYNGDIYNFITTIQNLKKEDNFYNIDNIKIENINETKAIIKFSLLLIKNR